MVRVDRHGRPCAEARVEGADVPVESVFVDDGPVRFGLLEWIAYVCRAWSPWAPRMSGMLTSQYPRSTAAAAVEEPANVVKRVERYMVSDKSVDSGVNRD